MERRSLSALTGSAVLFALVAGCTSTPSASNTSPETVVDSDGASIAAATPEVSMEPSLPSSPTPADASDLSRKEANRLLLAAAESGDVDAATRAIDAGARLETRDGHERTPLLLASTYDNVDVARLLVAAGADRTPSTTGTTPRGWSPA